MTARSLACIPIALLLVACASAGASPSAAEAVRTPEPTGSPTVDPVTAVLGQCAETDATDADPLELELRAQDLRFDTDRLEGPQHCEPFTITLVNAEAEARHNVAIEPGGERGLYLFDGELTPPGTSTTYEIPPLPAGEYRFLCAPHWDVMDGVLVVEDAA